MEEVTHNLTIDFGGLMNEHYARSQHLMACATVALKGVSLLPNGLALGPLPEAQLDCSKSPDTPVDPMRDSTVAWLRNAVVRDLIDSFATFLEDLYRVGKFFQAGRKLKIRANFKLGPRPIRDIAQATLDERELYRFDKLGVGDKLNRIQEVFSIACMNRDEIVHIQKVRNCLTHRGGLVDPAADGRDDPSGCLRLNMRGMRLLVQQPEREPELLHVGMIVEKGGQVILNSGFRVEAVFAPHELLRFTEQQVVDVYWTTIVAAMNLVEAFGKLAGVDMTPKQNPPSAAA